MSSIEKYMNKIGHLNGDEKSNQKDQEASQLKKTRQEKQQQAGRVDDAGKFSQAVEIDINALRTMGALTPDQATGQIVDEFRVIKRPILKYAFDSDFGNDQKNNLVMVTSTFPNEGKTFNSICLAMSIVMEMDYTVLLVETDLARPSIMQYMGIGNSNRGIADYLLGEEPDLSNLILNTNIPKLSLMPAGRPHAGASELIASNSMKNMIEELGSRYKDRIIIFDSPPLLSSNDAVVLSQMMGQIILVIESGKTEQSAVKEAIERLDSNQNTGIILNKKIGGAGKGYGYHGYYGS